MKYLLLITILSTQLLGKESCSRIAIIDYQEVMVDAGPRAKGEGLRYYLEKDKKSVKLLNNYQEKNKPSTILRGMSSVGSVLVLGGLVQNDSENANRYLASGLFLSLVSYLFTKTQNLNNEKILDKAVNEYNKRNYPQIYFSPFRDTDRSGINVGVKMEY